MSASEALLERPLPPRVAAAGLPPLLRRHPRERARSERPQPRLITDLLLLVLSAAAIVAVATSWQPARVYLVAMAACLVPGAAILTRLAVPERLCFIALSIGLSLAVVIAGSLAMVWSHWWHPQLLGIALLLCADAALIRDAQRAPSPWRSVDVARALATSAASWRSPSMRKAAALVPLLAGVALWACSLPLIHTRGLGSYGLPPALPWTWYAALLLLICGAAAVCWTARPSPALIGVYVLALVIILYATVPAITPVPHYPWVYKHVGVTRSIILHGGVNASGDIYNRWPGFFAAAAAFSSWAHLDPLAFAAWAEPFFAALDAFILAAIAFAIAEDWRVAGYAALMFTLGDWIGQNYFAPQAMAFTLTLAFTLVLVRTLARGHGSALVSRALERTLRRPQPPVPLATTLPWGQTASVAMVLAIDAVIVATHQLTPYILLLQVGALALLGIARPRWAVLGWRC